MSRSEIGNSSQQRKKQWACPESRNIRSSDLWVVVSFSTPAHKWLFRSEGGFVANCKVCSYFTFCRHHIELLISVLQSIYEIMQFLTTSRANSRLNRLIYRGDIAQKIAEQDRRLDITITAFQVCRNCVVFKLQWPNFFCTKLKSSIVLRTGGEKSSDLEREVGLTNIESTPRSNFEIESLAILYPRRSGAENYSPIYWSASEAANNVWPQQWNQYYCQCSGWRGRQ